MSEVSVVTVLAGIAEFTEHGGASMELVAWDHYLETAEIARVWRQALQAGLVEAAGTDPTNGEQLYQLTELGREELRRARGSDGVA